VFDLDETPLTSISRRKQPSNHRARRTALDRNEAELPERPVLTKISLLGGVHVRRC